MIRKTLLGMAVALMLFPLAGLAQRHEYKFSRGSDLSISIGASPLDETANYYNNSYYDGGFYGYWNYYGETNQPSNTNNIPGLCQLYDIPLTRRGNGYISGAINVGYTYRVQKWFELSAYLTYSGYYVKYYDAFSPDLAYSQSVHSIGAIPFVRFVYLNKKYVKLYSGVGLGVGILTSNAKPSENFSNLIFSNDTETTVVGSLNLFGIRLGNQVYGFCELSVGSMGIVTAGVGFKLN